MNKSLFLCIAIPLLAASAAAEFEFWTNSDGMTAKMKLLDVTRDGDEIAGKFILEDDREITIGIDRFSVESADRIRAWEPKPEVKSVFDNAIKDNLVILEGRKFTKHEISTPPTKYYIFYYTASWCPPCQKFTPSLVNFYKQHKNDNFEIILVSSDRDAKSMLDYAAKAKMPWPQIELRKIRQFKSKFDHGVRGIPSVIVCQLDGTQVQGNFRDLAVLKNLVK